MSRDGRLVTESHGWRCVTNDELFGAVNDSAFFKVVGRKFNGNRVACHDTDVVLAHLSGDMSDNRVTVFKFYAEHSVRQGFSHRAFHLYCFFFCHK